MVTTMTAVAKAETTVATEAETGGVRGRMTEPPPSVMTVGEMLRIMGIGDRSSSCDRGGGMKQRGYLQTRQTRYDHNNRYTMPGSEAGAAMAGPPEHRA